MKLAALALLLCLNAHADVIGVDIASVHAHPGMNNINPGIYYRWNNDVAAGVYYNSEKRVTAWAGYVLHDSKDRFAITLGAAVGYKQYPVIPMVVPSVRFGLDDKTSLRLSLAVAPKNPALHLSLERRF